MASTIPEQSFAVDSSAQEDTGFTLQSLKDHGSRDSFYMLLHDKVYDVTAFLDEVGCGLSILARETQGCYWGTHEVWGARREANGRNASVA